MTTKELLALTKVCRKAGITHFKNDEIEFTLTPQETKSNYRKRKEISLKTGDPLYNNLAADQIESDGWDTLTIEQKLNWSSDPLISESSES